MIRSIRTIRTIRNIPRLKDITFILVKHGLHQIATSLGAPLLFRIRRLWHGGPSATTSQAERLRLAFQELGPIFIKVGQIIASRPDLFPETWVHEFAKLQDRVEEVPFAEIRGVLKAELGDPDRHFREIDPRPLAAASIAQIHRATTLAGEQVILKVQRPGIWKIIERDMEIFALVAEALAGIEEMESIDPEGLVAEVNRSFERELNFNFERNAIERVRASFEGDPVLVVPRTYPEISTDRLLVMDHLDGVSLRHLEPEEGQAREIARHYTRVLFEMIFRDGYFHADPHAANVLVLEGGKLGLIDFGSMGLFTDEMRSRLVRLLRALLARDYGQVARLVLRLGRPRGEVSVFEFSQDLASRLDPFFGLSLKELDLSALFNTVLDLARDHRVSIAPGFILMTRCLVLMQGVTQTLDPSFDTMEEVEPLAKRYLKERYRPDRLVAEVEGRVMELVNSLWEYPQHAGEVLRKMAQGRFQVDTHLQGLERFGRRIEGSSNSVVQALIVSSLLISSSLIMDNDLGPELGGAPVIALAGYVVAGLIGLRVLVMSFWRP